MNIPKSQIQPNTLDPEMMNLVPGRRSDMFGGNAVILAVEELADDVPLDVAGNRADIIFGDLHNSLGGSEKDNERLKYMVSFALLTGIALNSYDTLAEVLAERGTSLVHIEDQMREIAHDSAQPMTREESMAKTLMVLGMCCADFPVSYEKYQLQRGYHADNALKMAERVIASMDAKLPKYNADNKE